MMISFTENYKNRVWKGHMLMKKQARQQNNFGKLNPRDQAMTRINTRYLLFVSICIDHFDGLSLIQGLCSTRICQVSNNSNNIQTKPPKWNENNDE